MIRRITGLRALPFALAAVASFGGCKKDGADANAPTASQSAAANRPYASLSKPLEVSSSGIVLTQLDGTTVSFGSLATDSVVVVVPWVPVQKDAVQRVSDVRDALSGVPGVRIVPVIVDRDTSPERLAELAKQSEQLKLPIYVDAQPTMIRFLNSNMGVVQGRKPRISVPSYAVLTENLLRVTFAPKTDASEFKGALRNLVDDALANPIPTARSATMIEPNYAIPMAPPAPKAPDAAESAATESAVPAPTTGAATAAP